MQFLLKEGGTIDNALQDEHFYRERSRISTNVPPTHERIIAAFVTVANSRGLGPKWAVFDLTVDNVGENK